MAGDHARLDRHGEGPWSVADCVVRRVCPPGLVENPGMSQRPQRPRPDSPATPEPSPVGAASAADKPGKARWGEVPAGVTPPAPDVVPGPPGPRSFGEILWATDWRPGEVVELIRPGPGLGTLLLLAAIPAVAVALLCLFLLPGLPGATSPQVYSVAVAWALIAGALATIWVTGVNPRRKIRFDWETRQLQVTTVAGTRRWPFSEIRRLTKYQKNQHVQLYAGLPGEPVVLFDSDDHGRRGLEMKHKELTPLAMELTVALEVPPSQGSVVADTFTWWQIVRQSSWLARGLLVGLLAWCAWEGIWRGSNWLLGAPIWVLLAFLQFQLPTALGVSLGKHWYAGGRKAKVWWCGGMCLVAGMLLFAGAVWALRMRKESPGVSLLAPIVASVATAGGLFGVGLLGREHLKQRTHRRESEDLID